MNFNYKKYLIYLIILLFIFITVFSSFKKSSTFDETHYLALGKGIIKKHSFQLGSAKLHPPLFFYISSIPFYFVNIPDFIYDIENPIKRGQQIIFLFPKDIAIRLARLPSIVIAVFLILIFYKWANELYGINTAIILSLFLALSPNIIAHSRLATPDIYLTFGFFTTTYYLWKMLTTKKNIYIFWFSIFAAFTSLVKYNGLFVIFTSMLIILYYAYKERNFGFAFKSLFILIFILFISFFASYQFHYGNISLHKKSIFPTGGFVDFTTSIKTPFPEYFEGIIFQKKITKSISFYLNGKFSKNGWFSYYVFAFFYKTPLIYIFLLITSKIIFLKYKSPIGFIFITIPPFLFFIAMSLLRINIGLRYILPCYPFMFIFFGIIWKNLKPLPLKKLISIISIMYIILINIYIFPHYLAFFNVLSGGPKNGYKHLIDSNIDWGQDLKSLADYLKKNNIKKINLSYFGTAPPEYYGIKYNLLDPYKKQKGVCAISVTFYQGGYLMHKNMYNWLKKEKPISNIGYSILIFKVK